MKKKKVWGFIARPLNCCANNEKRGVGITRKGKLIQEQILRQIDVADYPLSSRQLAVQLGYSWNTIQLHCLELLFKKKIDRIETPGAHLWILVGCYEKKNSAKIHDALDTLDCEIEKTVNELLERKEIGKKTGQALNKVRQDKERQGVLLQ